MGLGRGSGRRCTESMSWSWCSVASKCSSSIFVTAPMSPGPRASTSSWSRPCRLMRCPIRTGFFWSSTISSLFAFTVPWCTRKTPSLPTCLSVVTLNTCASTGLPPSASAWNSTSTPSVSFSQERARVALQRVGQQARDHVHQVLHARAGLARAVADRHQVRVPQRRLERVVQHCPCRCSRRSPPRGTASSGRPASRRSARRSAGARPAPTENAVGSSTPHRTPAPRRSGPPWAG
jgi:hypothetical protein